MWVVSPRKLMHHEKTGRITPLGKLLRRVLSAAKWGETDH